MTLIDKAEALLPCPFCGNKPSTLRQNGIVQATCDDFDCPAFDVFAPIAAWNRRAAITEEQK